MLQPPEKRIAELVFPKSLQGRAKNVRATNRENKWAEKFKRHLGGFTAKKWAERLKAEGGAEELEEESKGTAKVKEKGAACSMCVFRHVCEQLVDWRPTRDVGRLV